MPPTHNLFRDQTLADLNQEMTEDLLLRRAAVMEELEENDDRPRSRQDILLNQLASINKVLGDEMTYNQDDLVAYWDEQLDRGEEPDLDMTVDDLKRLRSRGR